MPRGREFFLFSVSGLAGFLVDSSVLYLLKDGLGLYVARGASFSSAVFVTWLVNRSLTFGDARSRSSRGGEFFRYFCFMVLGGVVNYLVYAFAVSSSLMVASCPLLGVAAGSLAGLVVNFYTAKVFVFRRDG